MRMLDNFLKKVNNGNIAFTVAADAVVRIKRRVARGVGLKGRFDPYSTHPYYRDKKERPIGKGGRGRSRRKGKEMSTRFYEGGYAQFAAATKGTKTVNLSATGGMLRSLQAMSAGKNKATLSFLSPGESLKALYVHRRRPFFGFTPGEKRAINRQVKELLT